LETIEMENSAVGQLGAEAGPEVIGVAKRRVFSSAYKRQILEEADRARPGEIGLILRREGLYSSQLAAWRKRRSGVTKKETTKGTALLAENKRLAKENSRLKLKLRKVEAMLALQKKAHEILGYDDEIEESSS
jgi:transposase-like protein